MSDESMTGEAVVRSLRNIIAKLEVENADLERHNKELREAVAALLAPAPSQVSRG
jgi:exonuclease VII small subunit